MVTIKEATAIIDKETELLNIEKIDLLSSLGKVLAEDILSKEMLPPFNKSAMDGYALRSSETFNGNLKFTVKETIKAGDFCERELENREAFKIMTGAEIPESADTVIQLEKVEINDNEIILFEKIKSSTNIIKKGSEIEKGKLALKKGVIIRPSEIGLLASLGYEKIDVYRAPNISLIMTGSELVEIGEKIGHGKIRNSNEYSLTSLILQNHGNVNSFGIVPDIKEILKEKMLSGFENSDIIISSGGASVGDYDFIHELLLEIGADIKFEKVAIKPGKPVIFATYKGKLFFGLPGNPLSIITAFEQFVKPVIKKMLGKDSLQNTIKITLTEDYKIKKGRVKQIYVNLEKKDGKYYASKISEQCSNHLITLSKSNGIIIIPEDKIELKKGDLVDGRYIFK